MIATFTAYSSEIEATQVYYSFFFFLLYEFNYTLNNSYFSSRLKKKKKTIILVNPQQTTKLCYIVKFLWTIINIIRKYERTKDISPHLKYEVQFL